MYSWYIMCSVRFPSFVIGLGQTYRCYIQKAQVLDLVFCDTASIKFDQPKAGQTNQCVDDTGEKSHAPEQHGDQVKAKQTDQSPVDGADDGYGQGNTIKTFHK